MKACKRQATTAIERTHPFNVAMAERRLELGWSYQTLADKIGSSSKSYLSDIEKGKYAVSIELGFAICQLLDIDIAMCIDYIYTIEHERVLSEINRACQEWYEMTPDEVRERMMKPWITSNSVKPITIPTN